ncbi:MAG TPA: HD domain-containing phosphohydrolase, partial [Spirochaetota bacterium]
IYVCKGDSLIFNHVQNDTIQQTLPPGRRLPYTVYQLPINQSSISGYVASTGEIVNIPNVYELSTNLPFHFDPFFDLMSHYRTSSMLTVPLKNNLGAIIGVLQLINAKNPEGEIGAFPKEDEPLIMHFASIASMVLERAGMTRAMILRMIQMAELRDPKETGAHVNRVASYAVEIYEQWGVRQGKSSDEIDYYRDLLRMAAMLHDVGKVAIPDIILKKPAKFTPEEYEIMKTHTWSGSRLFSDKNSELDEIAQAIALTHHENWDGSGYPGKINIETGMPLFTEAEKNIVKGEDIPIWGRIVALADVYDALSSRRVYKNAWNENDVLTEIKRSSGIKFDPLLVDIFFDDIENIRSLRAKYPDHD